MVESCIEVELEGGLGDEVICEEGGGGEDAFAEEYIILASEVNRMRKDYSNNAPTTITPRARPHLRVFTLPNFWEKCSSRYLASDRDMPSQRMTRLKMAQWTYGLEQRRIAEQSKSSQHGTSMLTT